MKIAVLQFPGTNCEFETLVAVKTVGMDGEIFRWNRRDAVLFALAGLYLLLQLPGLVRSWSLSIRRVSRRLGLLLLLSGIVPVALVERP